MGTTAWTAGPTAVSSPDDSELPPARAWVALSSNTRDSAPQVHAVLGGIAGGGAGVYPLSVSALIDSLSTSDIMLEVLAIQMAWTGAATQRVRTAAVFKPQNAVAINPEATIWTPAAGKKFRLMGGLIASSVAGNVVLRDNTAGTIIAVVPCLAGEPVRVFGGDAGNGILSAVANNVLTATGPAASTLSGTIFGTEE